jgi:hypothetical protein
VNEQTAPDRRPGKPVAHRRLWIAGIVLCLVIAAIDFTVIWQGHAAVGSRWAPAVTAGAGASLGLIAVIGVAASVARWRKRLSRVLAIVVTGLTGALLLITWIGLRIVALSGAVTSPWQVGLAAFGFPVACLALALIPLAMRRRSPGRGQARR